MSLACQTEPTAASSLLRLPSASPDNIIESRDRFLLNTLPGDSDAYKRTCIYIIIEMVCNNRDISTSNLVYKTKRFGYTEEHIEKYLNALNLSEFQLVRWWKNKRQRRTGYRFWVIADIPLVSRYMEYLVRLHPELAMVGDDLRLRKGTE